MKIYIISLCCTAIAAAIACVLAPGEGKGVKFVSGLCILAAFAYPLAEAVGDLKNIDFSFDSYESDRAAYTQIMYESLDSVSRENVLSDIEKIMSERFGIGSDEYQAEIELTRDGDTVTLEKIYIVLEKSRMFENPHDISDYIGKIFACECIVSVG